MLFKRNKGTLTKGAIISAPRYSPYTTVHTVKSSIHGIVLYGRLSSSTVFIPLCTYDQTDTRARLNEDIAAPVLLFIESFLLGTEEQASIKKCGNDWMIL